MRNKTREFQEISNTGNYNNWVNQISNLLKPAQHRSVSFLNCLNTNANR